MEEISLRELIEIILKGKWVIAVVTVVCVLVAGVVSFFVLESTYEAQTMLMVSPISTQEESIEDGETIQEVIATLSRYPRMTVDTYKEQVKAPEVLQYVKQEAGLDDLTMEQVGAKIDVQAIDNTNIITIAASDHDPEKAALIANLVSEKFTGFVSDTNRKQAINAAEFIKTEQEREKERLDEAHERLKDFLAQPRGPEELRQELNSKMSQLTSFKTQKNSVMIEFNIEKGSLYTAGKLLENTPMHLETKKVLSGDELMLGVARDATGRSTSELAALEMTEQELNPAYTELVGKVNNFEISVAEKEARIMNLQEAIAELQADLEKLQAEYAEKQKTYDQLQHEYSLIKQAYDAYRQKYKEAMIKQSAEFGKSSIVVVSGAVPPENPVSPNKKLNVAIAFVLGLMISVFAVFIREYWETSGQEIAGKEEAVS